MSGVFDSLAEAHEHLGARLGTGFDFALLDIGVTDGKSAELTAELLDRHVPFAFVSAAWPSELQDRLQHARFIPKPFDEATIVRSLQDPRSVSVRYRGLCPGGD